MADLKIGLTLGTMTTLTTLGLPEPNHQPVHYAEHIPLGNAQSKGAGWLQAQWVFYRLTTAQVALLRAYCPEPATSASVYIKTWKQGGGLAVYSAIMEWPQVEPQAVGGCFDEFEINFHSLVAAST